MCSKKVRVAKRGTNRSIASLGLPHSEEFPLYYYYEFLVEAREAWPKPVLAASAKDLGMDWVRV